MNYDTFISKPYLQKKKKKKQKTYQSVKTKYKRHVYFTSNYTWKICNMYAGVSVGGSWPHNIFNII